MNRHATPLYRSYRRIALLFVAFLLWMPTASATETGHRPLLYIVNSYDPATFGWTQRILDGFHKGLATSGMIRADDYQTVTATLNAFKNNTEDALAKKADEILKDIATRQPDLVLTTDDDALRWVGLRIQDAPVVFNGINGNPDKYLFSPRIKRLDQPGFNITGVYQTSYFKQSLDFLLRIKPSAQSYAIITDETTTGQALYQQFIQIKRVIPLFMVDRVFNKDFAVWKQKILEWQGHVDFLFVLSTNAVERKGRRMASDEVIQWISENSTILDTCPWAYQIKAGILVSATDSAEQQGIHSAKKAVAILSGASKPGDIPISTPPNGVPALNTARAKRLNIRIPSDMTQEIRFTGQMFE